MTTGLEQMDIPVELQPLFTAQGQRSTRKAVVRTDTGEIVSDVSNRYQLVTHKELFNKVKPLIDTFGEGKASCHSSGLGSKLLWQYDFKDISGDVKVGDNVGFRVMLDNSYDTKSSFGIAIHGLRLKCLNGMAFPGGQSIQCRYGHTGQLRDERGNLNIDLPKPDELVNLFRQGIARSANLAKLDMTMGDLELMRDRAIVDRIVPEKFVATSPLEEVTAWGLYNQITHHITHTSKASIIGKTRALENVATWFNKVFN